MNPNYTNYSIPLQHRQPSPYNHSRQKSSTLKIPHFSQNKNNSYSNQIYSPYPKQYENRNNQNYISQSLSQKVINYHKLQFNQLLEQFNEKIFPQTFKLLDLRKFVNKNVKLRSKLIQQKDKLQKQRKKQLILQKQHTMSENNELLHLRQRSHQNLPSQQQIQLNNLKIIKQDKIKQIQKFKQTLENIRQNTQKKKDQIASLQVQQMNQSIHETPLLKQKHDQIQLLSVQIEWLNQKNSQLKKMAKKKQDIFQMYEQMCRQCQNLRKQNNKKSEKLKKVFQQLNKLTGKQENPNMFLMHLKV